jgi:arylsulfatase A-like enzyme
VAPGTVQNGLMSGLDWFPTLVAAAGNPNIRDELRAGRDLGGRTYRVHLDGYNQLPMLTGGAPSSRNEIFYFTEGTLSAVRIGDFKYRFTDQPKAGSAAPSTGHARRHQPAARSLRAPGMAVGQNGAWGFGMLHSWSSSGASSFVQQEVARYAETFVEFPPMQRGASFNLEAVKAQVEEAIERARRAHN